MTIDTQIHPTPRYGVPAAALVTGAALMNGI
jgi:hypothetical protein